MSKSVMISMLRQGSTGTEILNILNALTGGEQQDNIQYSEPTLDEIEF